MFGVVVYCETPIGFLLAYFFIIIGSGVSHHVQDGDGYHVKARGLVFQFPHM